MKLVFKVYAGGGSMVCGGLVVDTVTHTHAFYPSGTAYSTDRAYNDTPISRIVRYKGLRLIRMM